MREVLESNVFALIVETFFAVVLGIVVVAQGVNILTVLALVMSGAGAGAFFVRWHSERKAAKK